MHKLFNDVFCFKYIDIQTIICENIGDKVS